MFTSTGDERIREALGLLDYYTSGDERDVYIRALSDLDDILLERDAWKELAEGISDKLDDTLTRVRIARSLVDEAIRGAVLVEGRLTGPVNWSLVEDAGSELDEITDALPQEDNLAAGFD